MYNHVVYVHVYVHTLCNIILENQFNQLNLHVYAPKGRGLQTHLDTCTTFTSLPIENNLYKNLEVYEEGGSQHLKWSKRWHVCAQNQSVNVK